MGLVLNIRGTNGSGKSTLARAFTGPPTFDADRGRPVNLNSYPAPTKREPDRRKWVPAFVCEHDDMGPIGVVGSYRTACGGMDGLPNFETCQTAIGYLLEYEGCRHVIAEGILASTVYGSWGAFATSLRLFAHDIAFCYLDTPLTLCRERILARKKAAGTADKPINWKLVDDKFEAIRSTRDKAIAAGNIVFDIPHETAFEALCEIMSGEGDKYHA